jgi:hypothetical protein
VTRSARNAGCLVCALLALTAPAGTFAAEKPSPQELWKLYPLDPAHASGEPATTTPTAGPPSPPGGVAGTSTTRRGPERGAGSTAVDNGGGSTRLALGLVIGGLLAATLMLALALLPESATSRVGRLLAEQRLEMMVAGMLTLVIVTLVYLVSGV